VGFPHRHGLIADQRKEKGGRVGRLFYCPICLFDAQWGRYKKIQMPMSGHPIANQNRLLLSLAKQGRTSDYKKSGC
jgi:hypothetical protein